MIIGGTWTFDCNNKLNDQEEKDHGRPHQENGQEEKERESNQEDRGGTQKGYS